MEDTRGLTTWSNTVSIFDRAAVGENILEWVDSFLSVIEEPQE